MNVSNILRRAWNITKKHQALWIFGLMIAAPSYQGYFRTKIPIPTEMRLWLDRLVSSPQFIPMAAVLVLVLIVLGLLISLLKALGEAALISQVDGIEKIAQPSFSSGWLQAEPHVLRVYLISLMVNIPSIVLVLAGILPILAPVLQDIQNPGVSFRLNLDELIKRAIFCLGPMCGLSLLVSVVAGIIQTLSVRACVTGNRPVWASLLEGWQILQREFGAVASFWLTLVGVRMGIGSILAVPMCLLAALVAAPTVLRTDRSAGGAAQICGGFLLTWLAGVLVGGITETFFSACWTLAYREWVNKTSAHPVI